MPGYCPTISSPPQGNLTMREHPIIFSGPMVRALLEGRKTQTRRLAWRHRDHRVGQSPAPSPWQRVKPGDRLWVRESVCGEEAEDEAAGVRYAADDAWRPIANSPEASEDWLRLYTYRTDDTLTGGKPVPSIHMPRWASRITLHVEAVRVERLHSITDADAAAEGVDARAATEPVGMAAYRFRELWDSLHGAECWDANPEVVVLQFRALLGEGGR